MKFKKNLYMSQNNENKKDQCDPTKVIDDVAKKVIEEKREKLREIQKGKQKDINDQKIINKNEKDN